ncbi:MAG: YbhB/YbcL family Raf kinase inhibitor-like protein [Bacteroidota bacterium]|nr:YbhB/YbcL family Raf kinase inhibitor-like protein [Bacteroidota bacterium]
MNNPKFTITSTAFEDGKVIPTKYANTGITGGKNISIPLKWENVPKETKSYAISIIDLHPVANNWVHWCVIHIPLTVNEIVEGASNTNKLPTGSKELNNTFGSVGYGGPQPPKGSGLHKYEVTIYALDVEKLELDKHTSLITFRKAIDGKVIATAKTVGVFER